MTGDVGRRRSCVGTCTMRPVSVDLQNKWRPSTMTGRVGTCTTQPVIIDRQCWPTKQATTFNSDRPCWHLHHTTCHCRPTVSTYKTSDDLQQWQAVLAPAPHDLSLSTDSVDLQNKWRPSTLTGRVGTCTTRPVIVGRQCRPTKQVTTFNSDRPCWHLHHAACHCRPTVSTYKTSDDLQQWQAVLATAPHGLSLSADSVDLQNKWRPSTMTWQAVWHVSGPVAYLHLPSLLLLLNWLMSTGCVETSVAERATPRWDDKSVEKSSVYRCTVISSVSSWFQPETQRALVTSSVVLA